MRTSRTTPTGVERTFGDNELIVTKTDGKGHITYANSVFLRVSGLTEDEALGRPHNLVRHPDMPRCVYQLLWDRVTSGAELFAYVLNLATDGAHYWVFAHVTPSYGRGGQIVGYHSNRRTPDRSALGPVTELYASLCAEERRHPRSSEGLAAGTRALADFLATRDQSYDEWVWSLTGTNAEVGR